MNQNKMLAQMGMLSDDDIVLSMNNGTIPPWAGVSELNNRKQMRGAGSQPSQNSVLDEALGRPSTPPLKMAQGGLLTLEPSYQGPTYDVWQMLQQMYGGIGTPLPHTPASTPPQMGPDGGMVRRPEEPNPGPGRHRKSERPKTSKVLEREKAYYPLSAGVNSPTSRPRLPAGGVSSLISSMPGDMGGIDAPLSNNYHRASIFNTDLQTSTPEHGYARPEAAGQYPPKPYPMGGARPGRVGEYPTSEIYGAARPEAPGRYPNAEVQGPPEGDILSGVSPGDIASGAADLYGTATTPKPGDPAWLWAAKNGAKMVGDNVGAAATGLGGLMTYPYEAGRTYGDLVQKNLKQVMSPRYSPDSSMGMSFNGASPSGIASLPKAPASPAGVPKRDPRDMPPVPQTGTPTAPKAAPSPSNEEWVKSQIETQDPPGGDSSMPFMDMMKGMLPPPVDNSAILQQMRAEATEGRDSNKMLALLAFGSGMAGAHGSFSMGVGAGGAAMTPVMQQGMRDYQSALSEIAKETMADSRNNADLQSRNVNSLIGAANVDTSMKNATAARSGDRMSALLKGRELDVQEKRISAYLEAAKIRAGGKAGGMTPQQMDTAARDMAKLMMPDETTMMAMTPPEKAAALQQAYVKALELIQNQFGAAQAAAPEGSSIIEDY